MGVVRVAALAEHPAPPMASLAPISLVVAVVVGSGQQVLAVVQIVSYRSPTHPRQRKLGQAAARAARKQHLAQVFRFMAVVAVMAGKASLSSSTIQPAQAQ